jgi:SNF2 family DNA or RNA helicase
MGLGKTLELISYLAFQKSEGEERPSLVVCPASLVYNWRSEANRFAPSLDVVCLTGTKTERRKAIQEAGEHDLLVTSYDLLRRDVEELCQVRFSCVALDEAQYVKNAQTLAAKAARTLTSDVRFALTGTPIENRLLELWSIFDFLMPSMLGSAQAFTKRFANPINGGSTEAAANLRALVSPFILRRNKRDVLKDLPDKNETIVYASMEGEQDKLYRASAERLILSLQNQLPEEFAVSRIKVLAELTKLRQICCDPHLIYENYKGHSAKLDTCMELIRQAIEGGHKMLVFSQFTSMLELIEARLKKEKVGWLKLTGATSKEERVRLVDTFQTGETPVFLISLKAGGTGLNLTAADVVIHYDPWWNVAAENQATDRTHRIGQTREVSVFKIIAKDTIEENIQKMQEAKRDLAESVLGGEATSSSAISREDLLALLDAGLMDE